jgi:hypothetical protein
MNERNNNNIIRQNRALFTPDELKYHLEKINSSFSEYIKALNKDLDEQPDSLKNSTEYSTQIIEEFKNFYTNFNLLSDEMLTNNVQNNINTSKERNEVIIDNSIVKDINFILEEKINKKKKQNTENKDKIDQIKKEFKSVSILQKPSSIQKQNK